MKKLNKGTSFLKGIDDINVWKKVMNYIEQGRPIICQNNSVIETSVPFVLMEDSEKLGWFASYLRWNGSRLVINGKEDTPFAHVRLSLARRTYLLPIFLKGLGHLASSGMEERWHKMYKVYKPLQAQILISEYKFHKHVAMALFQVREDIVFHEADSISLKAVREVFVLCVSVLLVAFLCIMIECRIVIVYKIQVWRQLFICILKLLVTSMQKLIKRFTFRVLARSRISKRKK